MPLLKPITDDLMQIYHNKPLFHFLEEMRAPTTRNEYLASLLPLSIERKIDFMLTSVPQDLYMLYIKWLQDSLFIESRKDSESIYVDMARYIIINTRTDPNA